MPSAMLQKREVSEAPFTPQKKMGPDPEKSWYGPDIFAA